MITKAGDRVTIVQAVAAPSGGVRSAASGAAALDAAAGPARINTAPGTAPPPAAAIAPRWRGWRNRIGADADALAVLATLAAILLLYRATAASMADIWLYSPTFAHGLLIAPISLWLIWRQRARLSLAPRRPSLIALWPLAALGAGWLLATVANVQVLQQYTLVAMLPAAVVAMLGADTARVIAFPLAYLLLAVPFGEVLVPPMVDFTARFTVELLRLSGVPAFRENNFLTLPTGSWSVVDACSGLRYLIASFALGTLYAYLSYRDIRRRLAFIGVALLLPVFANGLRAYGIVLLGHWSDMRLAVGVDHLIYGWVFFCLISLLLFWIGSRWRDALPPTTSSAASASGAQTPGLPRAAVACIAVAAVWPLLAALFLQADMPAANDSAATSASTAAPELALLIADLAPPWHGGELGIDDWRALHAGQPQRYARKFCDGAGCVTLQVFYYQRQNKQAELLTPVRRSVQAGQPQWHESGAETRHISLGGVALTVSQTVAQAGATKLLVWRWYRQGGIDTASALHVKLLLAQAKLLRRRQDGADIVLAAPYDEQPDSVVATLQRALTTALPAIDAGLRHDAPR